ncbi:MAG: transporter substrate-binding domain-containing protein [Gammaproteobacteria bacterium]|nr:transporter substrate-binding domain-containing protein [Gammaproteobacteria bacterium]
MATTRSSIQKIERLFFIGAMAFLLLWLFISYSAHTAQLSETSPFKLTEKEKSWLAQHDEILIGVMDAWPPFNFKNKQGKSVGIGADYITLLNKRLGGRLKPVSGAWDELFQNVKDNKIDALMDITPKPDREKYFNFTHPYLNIPHIIVAGKNTALISNENALSGKTLALERDFGNIQYFKEHYPQVKIKEYKNTREALGAVAIGEADAYAGNRSVALYLIGEGFLTNLKVHGRLRKDGSVLAIGTRKNAAILATILDRALADITQEEIRKIHSRWTGDENSGKQLILTSDEQLWLKMHPTVRIAFDENYPPYSYKNEEGEFVGIAVDMAKEMAVRIGLQLKIYPEGQWQHIYSAAQDGDIDVIATMVKRGKRENWFSFTRPYLTLSQYIITQKNNLTLIQNKNMLAGKKVALVKDYSTSELLLEEIENIEPYFVANLQEALEAVARGHADATIGDIGTANHYIAQLGLTNLGFATLYTRSKSKQRFAVRNDWQILATILDKSMETLSYPELMRFYTQWNMPEVVKPETGFLAVTTELTDKEKAWLDAHPVIRLASDSFWPPFEVIDDKGRYSGIAADYMHLIEKRLGIKFVISPKKPWSEITQMLKNKELDVFSCAMETNNRKEYAQFTSPYISHQMVIVTQNNIGYINGLAGLNGKTIAVEKNYASYEIISAEHPELALHPYPDSKSAINAVSQGKVFAYIGNIATMSHVVRNNGITNLKVSGHVPYKHELGIGVRKDWPEFIPILEKTLDSINLEEKNAILQKWIAIESEKELDLTLIIKIIGAALIIFLAILYWNRKLSNEITRRKIVEDQLREHQVMLEQRGAELEFAVDEAKQANLAKSEFLSSMSHELRTPMNSILGFSELLSTDTTLDKGNVECAEEIFKAGKHLLSLINEVLDLSRVESGHVEFSLETVNVSQVIHDCFIFTGKLAETVNVRVSHSVPTDVSIITDLTRFKQILLNLITNAIKYNRDGGSVKLTAESSNNNTIRIMIRDTGKGIPANRMHELFEPFNRLGAEYSDIEGTGIGLTFTRRLVELLGGQLGVESKVDEGSVFWVEFPIGHRKESNNKEMTPLDDEYIIANDQPCKILYIDDNSANIKLVARYLNRHKNIQLVTAKDPYIGIQLADSENPDIILMDINMPEMDGYQALELLKSHDELKHIPVIALSAKAMKNDITKGKLAGFSEYLTKPLDIERFNTIITSVFDEIKKS